MTKEIIQCYRCGVEKGDGKMLRCRSCKVAHYCCKAHQKEDWPTHRKMCKEMRAEGDGKEVRKSQSLMNVFGVSMRKHLEQNVTPDQFPPTGHIYRATKQGPVFFINRFPMKDYFWVAKHFHPNDARRKEFLDGQFGSLKNGDNIFAVFSTLTKVHAITTVKKL